MNNVLYIGPNVNGRYQGGIMNIYNNIDIVIRDKKFSFEEIHLELFNSHVLKQTANSEGKFKLENILQAFYLLFRLSRKLYTKKYNLIHFNTSAKVPLLKDLLILKLATLFFNKNKVIIHIHMCGIDEVLIKNIYLRKVQISLLKNFYLIVLSNTFKNDLVSLKFYPQKIFYLANFHTNNITTSFCIKKTTDCLKLIFIGSISKRKGFVDLLISLTNLKYLYELQVLGEFESIEIQNICEKIIQEYNLNVKFHGYKSGIEKETIINKSQIMILPSYAEGFPLVIPEAFSYGLVVISTTISSIPEIIENNFNGFLFHPGDTNSLTNTLNYLYENPDILKFIKKNSIESASKFTFDKHLKSLNLIYNSILN
jgi:glycosyltransferase involved in cell wall biosynthesis